MQRSGGQGRHSLTEGERTSQCWAPSGRASQPGDDPEASEPGRPRPPNLGTAGDKGHRGGGQEVRLVAEGWPQWLSAGQRRRLSPTRPRWARTSRGQAGPCAAGH